MQTRPVDAGRGGPTVFCVSGIRDSGEAALTKALMAEFRREGLSADDIRHDGQDLSRDIGGTEPHRFYRAGAGSVSVFLARQALQRVREKC